MARTAILEVLLVLAILIGCDSNTLHPNAEQEITSLERSALDKWAQSNSNAYIDICANDATLFDYTPGAQLRIDGIEALRKYVAPFMGQIPTHTYEIVNPKVQVYDNTAIHTFHWKAATTDGNPLGGWKVTSVYHWKDGNWYMVHGHWSVVQSD